MRGLDGRFGAREDLAGTMTSIHRLSGIRSGSDHGPGAPGGGAAGTRLIRLDETAPDRALRQAAGALADGSIVAYPTDTLYGLGVDPTRAVAVQRLCRLKTRSARAGIPLIAASLTQVEAGAGRLPPLGRRLASRFWPGPLTLVFDPEAAFADGVCAADGSVAIRVPRGPAARRLAALCGGPITATSANRAGLGSAVALVLEQSTALTGPPSTIVDVRGRHPRLVREGAVEWERVLQSLA